MGIIKNPNHELESAKFLLKYQTSSSSKLHYQALERIVNKYNSGSISAKVADKKIKAINEIRQKHDDIKSVQYMPISIQKLEVLYLAYS